jgi:hypothetical protein
VIRCPDAVSQLPAYATESKINVDRFAVASMLLAAQQQMQTEDQQQMVG